MTSSTIVNNSRPPMTDDELFFTIIREPATPARITKTSHSSTFLGKAGSFGFEVLDTIGSSMAQIFSYSEFVPGSDLKEIKVSLFAFEIANTIVKGSSLMQSLLAENIQHLKNEILLSEGVQLLVSTDIEELLRITAADKREEFAVFAREVVRFGDMCKDLQWHNLDRVFTTHVTNKISREEAEITIEELVNLAERTSELYHEYHALDRLEQVYGHKLEGDESLHLHQKGESRMILQSELKQQRKLVRNLKKKSLWSKSLEEVVEKLADVVTFIHQAIAKAFDNNAAVVTKSDKKDDKKTDETPERLGMSGLALHYANLITQIDDIASSPMCLHSNVRDALYCSLPASVKAGVRSRLQALDRIEVMTMPQIKAEMEKTLHWLVPMATSTIKAHQSFGWVGEWANTGFEFGKKAGIRLQTLYHADKHMTDHYILDLIILLHRLINLANGQLSTSNGQLSTPKPQRVKISLEGKNILEEVISRRAKIDDEEKNLLKAVIRQTTLDPRLSKSQNFEMAGKKKRTKVCAPSRSLVSSPRVGLDNSLAARGSLDARLDLLEILDRL